MKIDSLRLNSLWDIVCIDYQNSAFDAVMKDAEYFVSECIRTVCKDYCIKLIDKRNIVTMWQEMSSRGFNAPDISEDGMMALFNRDTLNMESALLTAIHWYPYAVEEDHLCLTQSCLV